MLGDGDAGTLVGSLPKLQPICQLTDRQRERTAAAMIEGRRAEQADGERTESGRGADGERTGLRRTGLRRMGLGRDTRARLHLPWTTGTGRIEHARGESTRSRGCVVRCYICIYIHRQPRAYARCVEWLLLRGRSLPPASVLALLVDFLLRDKHAAVTHIMYFTYFRATGRSRCVRDERAWSVHRNPGHLLRRWVVERGGYVSTRARVSGHPPSAVRSAWWKMRLAAGQLDCFHGQARCCEGRAAVDALHSLRTLRRPAWPTSFLRRDRETQNGSPRTPRRSL